MDGLFIVMVGALVAAAVYLLLARDLPRVLIGFVLLGTGVNLAILAAGRVGAMVPPLVPPGSSALPDVVANPLPQALILTAIVIGFGLTAFALMLVVKVYARFRTVAADDLTEAEGAATPAAATLASQTPLTRQEAA
ncbi:MAG: cation:proton antiporter [Alphaproteobacteria bacterium]|nr:MAG: cation:proton antiporter [Alphaproteobacteria bacterium]